MVELYTDNPKPRRKRRLRANPLAPMLSQIVQRTFKRSTGPLGGRGSRTYKDVMEDLVGGLPDEVPVMYDLASPITHVNPQCPPTLQIIGLHDSLVPPSASKRLHHALQAAGVTSILVEIPQTEHAFDLVILPQLAPAAQAALYDVDRFLALMAGE
jgi:acetyl esterase/lipase